MSYLPYLVCPIVQVYMYHPVYSHVDSLVHSMGKLINYINILIGEHNIMHVYRLQWITHASTLNTETLTQNKTFY